MSTVDSQEEDFVPPSPIWINERIVLSEDGKEAEMIQPPPRLEPPPLLVEYI